MIAKGVAARKDAADEVRMFFGVNPGDKKGRFCGMSIKKIQKTRRDLRVRAVIEGKGYGIQSLPAFADDRKIEAALGENRGDETNKNEKDERQ